MGGVDIALNRDEVVGALFRELFELLCTDDVLRILQIGGGADSKLDGVLRNGGGAIVFRGGLGLRVGLGAGVLFAPQAVRADTILSARSRATNSFIMLILLLI